MNRYIVTGPVAVGVHEPGSEFDGEFTAEAEHDLLAAGRVELVPRAYRVVGTRMVFGVKPGGVVTAALTVGRESALITAGHLERHDKPAKPGKQPAASAADTEE